jgi:hypothetical protein
LAEGRRQTEEGEEIACCSPKSVVLNDRNRALHAGGFALRSGTTSSGGPTTSGQLITALPMLKNPSISWSLFVLSLMALSCYRSSPTHRAGTPDDEPEVDSSESYHTFSCVEKNGRALESWTSATWYVPGESVDVTLRLGGRETGVTDPPPKVSFRVSSSDTDASLPENSVSSSFQPVARKTQRIAIVTDQGKLRSQTLYPGPARECRLTRLLDDVGGGTFPPGHYLITIKVILSDGTMFELHHRIRLVEPGS